MKKLMVLVLSVFMVTALGLAQPVSQERLNRTIENYEKALGSEIAGLRHDAIFQVVKMRCACPEQNLAVLVKKLQKMANNDENPIIRLHAELACLYLKNDCMLNKIRFQQEEDALSFFNRLHQVLTASDLALQL